MTGVNKPEASVPIFFFLSPFFLFLIRKGHWSRTQARWMVQRTAGVADSTSSGVVTRPRRAQIHHQQLLLRHVPGPHLLPPMPLTGSSLGFDGNMETLELCLGVTAIWGELSFVWQQLVGSTHDGTEKLFPGLEAVEELHLARDESPSPENRSAFPSFPVASGFHHPFQSSESRWLWALTIEFHSVQCS